MGVPEDGERCARERHVKHRSREAARVKRIGGCRHLLAIGVTIPISVQGQINIQRAVYECATISGKMSAGGPEPERVHVQRSAVELEGAVFDFKQAGL